MLSKDSVVLLDLLGNQFAKLRFKKVTEIIYVIELEVFETLGRRKYWIIDSLVHLPLLYNDL